MSMQPQTRVCQQVCVKHENQAGNRSSKAIASVIVLIPSSAKAEWLYAASANGVNYLIEDTSIRTQGKTVEFWRRDILERPFRGQAKQVITHYSVNCSNKASTVISSTAYNRNGKPLSDPKLAYQSGKISNSPVGTAGYAVAQIICGN